MSTVLQVASFPGMPPYYCFRCRADASSQRPYFIDTGIHVDFEGQIYFCSNCITDIAFTAPDIFTEKQMNDVRDGHKELAAQARKAVMDYESIIDYLEGIGFSSVRLLEIIEENTLPPVENFDVPQTENEEEYEYGVYRIAVVDEQHNFIFTGAEQDDAPDVEQPELELSYVDTDASGEVLTATIDSSVLGKWKL